jgi:hypothetical protein
MNVKFKEWNCVAVFEKYRNGRTAIQLMDAEDGSPIATATVNLPDFPLAEDRVAIKDYSENEGMLDALVEAGIVEELGLHAETGFVTVPICKLLVGEDDE